MPLCAVASSLVAAVTMARAAAGSTGSRSPDRSLVAVGQGGARLLSCWCTSLVDSSGGLAAGWLAALRPSRRIRSAPASCGRGREAGMGAPALRRRCPYGESACDVRTQLAPMTPLSKGEDHMNRRVAANDGSPAGLAAADWAARQALYRNLPLSLVHLSADRPSGETTPVSTAAPREGESRLISEQAQRDMVHSELAILEVQLEGDPRKVLLREAAGAEMLILGSRPLRSSGGFVPGDRGPGARGLHLAAHSDRPVIIDSSSKAASSGDSRARDKDL